MANTTWYVDPEFGTSANDGLTESTPKATMPAVQNGDVVRMKRGTIYNQEGSSILQSNRQGLIITDYGSPSLPKPVFRLKSSAGTYGFLCQGDTLFHNLEFRDFRITDNETETSPIGPHAINFNRRNGTIGNKGVSGAVINCDFKNIGANAIMCNASSDGSAPELVTETLIVLGCRFDGIGADGIFGAMKNLRVGHCTFHKMGQRIDSSYTPPVGGWQSTSDCIGAFNGGGYWWIHDNWMDHSDYDCKQCFGASSVSGDTNNYCLVERNVMLGYRDSKSHTPINMLANGMIRNNFVWGSRILLNVHMDSTNLEVENNIFHQLSESTFSAIEVFGDNTKLTRNTIIGNGSAPWALRKRSGVHGFVATENIFKGFQNGIYLSPDTTDHYVDRNGWYNVTTPYSDDVGQVSNPANDITFSSDPLLADGYTSDRTLTRIDGNGSAQVRDFFGRFPGITNIGALTSLI